jgi:hypothetical protein
MNVREYSFSLVVSGFDVDDDAQVEAFYRHGCDDAMAEKRGDQTIVAFDRTSHCAESALWSAVADVEAAVPGARVLRVDDDLVNATDIAERVDRTPESVRQLASGARGPGGFPAPVGVVGNGIKVWRWADVQQWLSASGLGDDELTLPVEVAADANAELARRRRPATTAAKQDWFASPHQHTAHQRLANVYAVIEAREPVTVGLEIVQSAPVSLWSFSLDPEAPSRRSDSVVAS